MCQQAGQWHDYAAWLDPRLDDEARLAAMTAGYPAELLESYSVSIRVDRADEEGETLIEPVDSL